MKIVTQTVFGSGILTAKALGIPHIIQEYTTINEAINDNTIITGGTNGNLLPSALTKGMEYAEVYNAQDDTPSIKEQYFCIGHGAHRYIAGPVQGVDLFEAIPHRADDACLYRIIPFVVKPLDQDLSPEQRQVYRLRRTIELSGEMYVAYYARKINLTDSAPEYKSTSVSNGVETSVEFVPNIENLRLTPPPPGTRNNGAYVHASAPVTINFNQQEIDWLREACDLLYGSPEYAIISEIAFCSGVDKPIIERYSNEPTPVRTTVSGESIREVVGLQANAFVSSYHGVSETSDGFNLEFDLGATEALYGAEAGS